jgi:zinc/manganese transport system substrate-binding protein
MKNKSYNKITLKTSCIALSFLFLLSACGGSSTPKSTPNSTPNSTPTVSTTTTPSAQTAPAAKIKITAAENFYGEAVKAVGGDRVEVTSVLTNPSVDPHDYEPTPEVARTVSDSKIIVFNGVGYDGWMEKLVNADPASKSKSVIKVADDLMGKKDGDNPHVWYDPETMPKLANKIADELTKLDPSGDQIFHKNAQTYISSLNPIKAKIEKIKQTGGKIDVSESIFDYMADALNLSINNKKFGKAINDGNDPSPADIAQLQNDLKGKTVKLFIYNIQNSTPTVDNILKVAKSSGVPIVEVTETEPAGKNYVQWMSDILDNIGKVLGIQ